MASTVSAKKRIRQNVKRRARNRWRLKTMRDAVKDYMDKVQHAGVDDAKASLQTACRLIDKTAGKGVIHKNTAARTKSRLVKRMKARETAA